MPSQRRQSFAPSATSSKSRGIGKKKRSRSFAPGEARQLAPRKSILKSAFTFNIPKDGEGPDDMTTDFTADLTMGGGFRKSLNKRVSFAVTKDIRIFEVNDQNTNSTAGPASSSPTQPSPERPTAVQLSNENDYPGRRGSWINRRRSSVGTEYGERSMSLDGTEAPDSPANPAFMFQYSNAGGSSDNEQDGDETEMDMTQAMDPNIRRKRSLSIAGFPNSRRSSIAITRSRMENEAQDMSMEEGTSADVTTSSMDSSRDDVHVEYTLPLEQSVVEPKPPSDAWLQLQALTGSGADTSTSSADGCEDMELTDAISRLSKARASFGMDEMQQGEGSSFSSNESAMIEESLDMGDRTLNLTNLMGSVRDMDITGYGRDSAAAFGQHLANIDDSVDSTPSSPPTAPPQIFTSSVFSAPPPRELSSSPVQESPEKPDPPTVPPPSRLPPPPVFAPAVPSGSASPRRSASAIPVLVSPRKKRPAESESVDAQDAPKPSPAKKHAVGLGRSVSASVTISPKKTPATTTPTPLSSQESAPSAPSSRASTSRRPSGYFAQRRSLLPGALSASTSTAQLNSTKPSLPLAEKRRVSIAVPQSGAGPSSHTSSENAIPPRSQAKFDALPAIVISDLSTTEDNDVQETEQDVQEMDVAEERSSPTMLPARTETVQSVFEEVDFEEEVPPISIEEFFTMTGVKFMDQLTIPRRSTIRPSQLQQSTSKGPDDSPSLADYVTAMNVHVPQLELYSWVSKDLQTWIDNSKKIYREAEDEVSKVTPTLFREYIAAEEEGRSELLHQLKLIKANKHSIAKEKWYEWKYEWTENLLRDAETGLAELENDEAILDEIISESESLLPSLRQQHAQILLELERERQEVAEQEESDPAFLEELKGTIDEQNALLDGFRSELAETNAKVERLQDKLQELHAQKVENEEFIAEADRKIRLHKNSTRTEVFRLKDELEALQALHSWQATKVTPVALELLYDNQFIVFIPCSSHQPRMNELQIRRYEESQPRRRRDLFPLLSEFTVAQAQASAASLGTVTLKRLVEYLSDFWTSCAQVRSQLQFLSIKFPVVLEPLANGGKGFKASASLLFHKQRAKAIVSFLFDEELLARWPFVIRRLACKVEVAYGAIDSETIHSAVMERLSEASVAHNHACLMDACVEATSRYE